MSDAVEKLSETLRFRAYPSFEGKVAALEAKTRWSRSDILRIGFELCWPDIEAHVLSQSGRRPSVTPAERRALADFRRLTHADPVVYLREAALGHLAARPSPLPILSGHD